MIHNATGQADQVQALVRSLRRLRARARALLFLRALSLWIACAIAALLAGGAIDFVLRAPSTVRLIGLIVALLVGAWAAVRFVLPALRFCPSLSEIALRLERSTPGSAAHLQGHLAAAIELADDEHHAHELPELRQRAIAEAVTRWRAAQHHGFLQPGPAAQSLCVLAAALLGTGALVALEPQLARIGAQRMLAPWSGAEWPKRQLALDLTPSDVHAIDEALAMRAAIMRTNRAPGKTPVKVQYRARADGQQGPWRSATLTGQNRRTRLASIDAQLTGEGELYERLLDPIEVLGSLEPPPEEGFIDYRFFTEDDQTPLRSVRIVTPPRVVRAQASIQPPDYAAPYADRVGLAVGNSLDLGRGDDERALVSKVLAGSRLSLLVQSSKPVHAEESQLPWLDDLRSSAHDVNVRIESERILISAVLDASVRIPVELIDEYGFPSREESIYVFDVASDNPPEPIVSTPANDEQMIPTAAVELIGQARDDLGVVAVALERRIARRPTDSEGAPAEPIEPWIETQSWSGSPTGQASVRVMLDLGSMGVRAGDEVWITATALDSYAAAGLGREPVRSSVRKLRIISQSELIEHIRAELGGLRQTAIRLDEQQAELRAQLLDQGPSRGLSSQQGELTDRIAAQQTTLDRLQSRLARNGLDDQALAGLLRDAKSFIASAASASSQAAEQIAEQAESKTDSRQAERNQQRVRDELASLIDQLDRGEDGWVARRTVERLLEEQREIIEQTRQASERMLGRDVEDLTPQQRSELDMIAERQREAARQAAEAIDELAERARQLSQADPAQAAAMAEAARQGRQQQIPQELDQAANEIQQNRTSSAQQGQQQAAEALERMLEELDQAERNRNAALLRRLASLIESLETLIRVQENQIEALTQARVINQPEKLDQGMIHLHDNTLAVSTEVRDPELTSVRAPLEQAIAAQASAISALRAETPDLETAGREEQESLLKLREARDEAERLEREAQQREQERIRRELRQAYRDQLEQQIVVRDEARRLEGKQLSRRDRASARGLGQREQTIHDALNDLVVSTEGLSEAAVFDFAHRRLATLTETAARQLQLGLVDAGALQSLDEAVSLLQSLVEALAPPQHQSEFDAGAAGAGGGGGAGSDQQQDLLPPIAELKLLRALQALVAEQTRAVAESSNDPDQVDRLAELQNELAAQARSLIERMQQNRGQAPNPTPDQPEVQ
ncbi:MAG: hypothetical protein D6695_03675 [Planctomycetota bacterium]|nr:MAG: hypothetical protein D6695_03675 [Planctomycetota bacterium]